MTCRIAVLRPEPGNAATVKRVTAAGLVGRSAPPLFEVRPLALDTRPTRLDLDGDIVHQRQHRAAWRGRTGPADRIARLRRRREQRTGRARRRLRRQGVGRRRRGGDPRNGARAGLCPHTSPSVAPSARSRSIFPARSRSMRQRARRSCRGRSRGAGGVAAGHAPSRQARHARLGQLVDSAGGWRATLWRWWRSVRPVAGAAGGGLAWTLRPPMCRATMR